MKHSVWVAYPGADSSWFGRVKVWMNGWSLTERAYVVLGVRKGPNYRFPEALLCSVEHVQSLMYGVWGPYNEESDQHREAPEAPVCCHVAVDTGFKRSWCKSCGVDMVFDAWDWKVEA